MEPATHAAHIVTSDAVALGDPEIIIMTRVESGWSSSDLVERWAFDGRGPGPGAVYASLAEHGWSHVGSPWTTVETGYYIVDVAHA